MRYEDAHLCATISAPILRPRIDECLLAVQLFGVESKKIAQYQPNIARRFRVITSNARPPSMDRSPVQAKVRLCSAVVGHGCQCFPTGCVHSSRKGKGLLSLDEQCSVLRINTSHMCLSPCAWPVLQRTKVRPSLAS